MSRGICYSHSRSGSGWRRWGSGVASGGGVYYIVCVMTRAEAMAGKITRDEVGRVVLDVLGQAYEGVPAGGRAEEAAKAGGESAGGFCEEDDFLAVVAGRGGTRGQIKYAVHGYEKRGLVEARRAVGLVTKYRLTEEGCRVWKTRE